MSEDLHTVPEMDRLPVRQRVAWMAAIWSLSVGAMVMVTMAIRSLIT